MNHREETKEALNSFDPVERRAALARLIREEGCQLPSTGGNLNMHFHSFFSYNAEGWSPSQIAWRARKAGLYAAGLCDFDVLDGLDEFLEAGLLVGLRSTVNLETRVYLKEYAQVDISSPGEPGVTYIMGAGFARGLPADSRQAGQLEGYRQRARQRNEALLARVNHRLPGIAVDYEKDVLPLTPSGNATERHIISAYVNKAATELGHAEAVASFWAGVVDTDTQGALELMADRPRMEKQVRSKLVKRGGLGYEQPSEHTFPPARDFIRWVLDCEAIPMTTWLDGTSGGERDGRALLECMREKGAVALNIIPDRNWNLSDPAQRAAKVANLNAIVTHASDMGLPINIGTEMNKLGLPFVDDLDAEALRPHREAFTLGARVMVGHTLLHRYAAYSYTGGQAGAEFPDPAARNAFFARVGALPPLSAEKADALETMGPRKALDWFRRVAD